MTGLMPMVILGAANAELTFLQVAEDTTNQTTYTFTSQSLGAAATDREIIVGVVTRGTAAVVRTISSATIGGVSADIRVETGDAGSGDSAHIIAANVPTGTTGAVSITFSGSATKCGIAMWRARRLDSRTPRDTGTDTDDVLSFTLDVIAGGIAVGVGMFDGSGAVTTSGLTEDQDGVLETQQWCAGSAADLSTDATYAISFDGPAGNAAGVAATWR